MSRSARTSGLDELAQEVVRLVEDTTGRPTPAEVPLDTTLLNGDLGVDSIDQVQIVVRLKERFGVAMPADGVEANAVFRSLRTLVAFVDTERRRRDGSN